MTVTHVAQAARMHRRPAGLAWALWALVMLGGSVIVALAIPVGAASLLVRFCRARGEERQQLRWVALAAVLASLAALLLLAGHAMGINALLNSAGCFWSSGCGWS